MGRVRYRCVVVTLALALAVGVGVWRWWQGPQVQGYVLERRPLVQTVVATGRVVTTSRAQVGSEITGVVLERHVFVAISVAFGIASVLSVSVVQRTREIGILRATGATRRQIMRVFLIQGALFGLLGSVMGNAVSYLLVWGFNTFGPGLFYIPVPTALVVAALLLATLTGVLAAAVPSRRAARLDPVVAIRYV